MKHAVWFRLVLKVIGVVLLVFALAELLPLSGAFLHNLRDERAMVRDGFAFGPSNLRRIYVLQATPYVVQMGLGVYLMLGGQWVVNLCIPPHHHYCRECGHDLSRNADAGRCDECGAVHSPSDACIN